jgi:flagellin
MSLVINNNIPALNVANNLNAHYSRLQTSTRRLSSGLRVGVAADDAAGLAIRELMRADIAAYKQGVRNAMDAISMIQVADGALQIIDEKLIRMKELAEQAATGTYDSPQRWMIDSEYQAMASEITRIANETNFNKVHLLDGSLSGDHDGSQLKSTGALKIHFGPLNNSAEDYYYIEIGSATASSLGVGNNSNWRHLFGPGGVVLAEDPNGNCDGRALSCQWAGQLALYAIDQAIVSKDKIRAALGAIQNRLENTVTNLTIQAENLQASEARISDADVATEMISFVRNQILAQAAVSMLAQANSLPRMALSLIG